MLNSGLLSTEQTAFLNIISAAVTGKQLSPLPKDLNYIKLTELSVSQGLVVPVREVLFKLGITENSKLLNAYYAFNLKTDALQEIEINRIFDRFELCGIPYMPLKGTILKKYYPISYYRTSGDIDILYNNCDTQKVNDIFLSLGYTLGITDENVYSFKKTGLLNVEMHSSLFKEGSTAYSCFKTPFTNAHICDSGNCRYEMSFEDTLSFLVAHTAKHFVAYGTGFRNVTDIYLFKKSNPEIDTNKLETSLEQLKLLTFYKKILHLAEIVFENASATDEDILLLRYFLSNGIYGTPENGQINAMYRTGTNKFTYTLKRIFPSFSELSSEYRLLSKFPFLLPIVWFIYITKFVLFKTERIKRYIKKNKQINFDDTSCLNHLINLCGLDGFK